MCILYIYYYIYYICHIKPVKQSNHITLSARKHPQMVSLWLACPHYSVSQFQRQRPKGQRLLWMPRSSSTTVLRKSVTRCWNCQGLQSSEAMSGFVRQSLATKELGWGDESPTIHQFDFAHLVGSPSPRLWMWTPAILHHISRLSKSPQNISPVCLTKVIPRQALY